MKDDALIETKKSPKYISKRLIEDYRGVKNEKKLKKKILYEGESLDSRKKQNVK